jgi:type IV pilus assembly protein PilB
MPPKAASIEDLLKKPSGGETGGGSSSSTPTSSSTAPSDTPSSAAPSPTASVADTALQEKLGDIKLQEREKKVAEEAAKKGMPYIALRGFPISPEALALIPRDQSKALRLVAFLFHKGEVRVGTTAPSKEVEELSRLVAESQHAHVETYLISDDSFEAAYALYDALPQEKEIIYGYRIEAADLAKYEQEISNFQDLQKKITSVSTTDVTTLMIGAALKSSASDIHVEAEEADIKIRFRMDGVLHEAAKLPKDTWKYIIGRLKLLAGVKINVEDVPQDGRITIYLAEEKIDIRVSFLPTAFGESVVMRLLRAKAVALEFESLGVRGRAYEDLKREIDRPNGMIITTGPTGSGKTTTLYAILKKLNSSEVKIITLEDPVEYKLEGINQSQIDYSKSYDFAKGLRSILRQDPDVVMVGEIRDLETAEISIQAALTGHLVVSTIHTNSAAGAIPRFLSMGVKPFLLAPALNAVIGQRLVRRLCPDCKVPAELGPAELEECKKILGSLPPDARTAIDLNHLTFMAVGKGCAACNNLGYKGRVGIYEIFSMSKEIERVILSTQVSEYQIQELAVKQGMITMAQDGLLKALEGLTSVEEVLSVANIDSTVLEPEVLPPASK